MTDANLKSSGNVQFERIEPAHLEQISTVAQSLDNTWVPQNLLRRMIDRGLALEDVKLELNQTIRAEYIRSLINSSQVIINRAYIYNNYAVFQDFIEPGASREAFKAFLDSGSIVPFLFNEETPLEEPRFPTDPRSRQPWEQVCQEVQMKCVRLSWGNDINRQLITSKLANRFHNFAQTINSPNDFGIYLKDLRLDEDAEDPFRKRCGAVAHRCVDIAQEDRFVTRDELYEEFICVQGSKSNEGKFDQNKPFAGEIKQLLDLNYNINLPDALGAYAFTPIDSISRTTLQEWELKGMQDEYDVDQILDFLKRSAFSLIQEGLYLKSLGELELSDVMKVRQMDEWAEYIVSVENLLKNPRQFHNAENGALAVYQNYVALAARMTRLIVTQRVEGRTALWSPIIELVLDIAGGIVSVIWSRNEGAVFQVIRDISNVIGDRIAPIVGRLVVRGFTEIGAQAELSTSIDIIRGRMGNAPKQWEKLIRQLRELPRFKEVPRSPDAQKNATINYTEESDDYPKIT